MNMFISESSETPIWYFWLQNH